MSKMNTPQMTIHNIQTPEVNNILLLLAGHISLHIFTFNFYATILRKITFLLLENKEISGSFTDKPYSLRTEKI